MEIIRYPKYENSPAEIMVERFVSTPASFHNPSRFDNNLNPADGFSPQSLDCDYNFNGSLSGLNLPEKKPIKKRKSWGQQLPEPKTNLPPRKRAKTEDEKEQRRVERVLRNRRAAQSSRERKRQEVEALEVEKRAIERKNMDLEMRLADMEAKYYLLQQELKRASGYNKTNFLSYSDSSTPDISEDSQLSPLTFSKQLFNAQDELCRPISPQSIGPLTSRTVDPSTLSPKSLSSPESSNSNSSDVTQHPAVSVGTGSALDEFDISYFENKNSETISDLPYCDVSSFFEFPRKSESEYHVFNDDISPHTNVFYSESENIRGQNDGVFDEFVICDLLNDEALSNESLHSDQLAGTTTNLQSQFGAFSHECDDGGIAV